MRKEKFSKASSGFSTGGRSVSKPVSKGASDPPLDRMQPDAAGIDIGSEEHYVAVPSDRDEQPVRCFGAVTSQLHALADWLVHCRIQTVAMESTGVYWIPLYQILESRGLEVRLVNTRQVKTVPGRKTDVLDCQWLQKLHSHGLLSGSFRPADDVCVLRTFLRQRAHLVEDASRQVQLMQKALQQMNVLLHHVVSDITGLTGMTILRAIVAGKRDPHQLAAYRDRRVKRSEAEIAEALTGDYRPEHLFCLEQALETYTFLLGQMEACDRQISAKLQEFDSNQEFDSKVDPESSPLPPLPSEMPNLKQTSDRNPKETSKSSLKSSLKSGSATTCEALYRWTGVDLTKIDGIGVQTAQIVLSEIGPDLSRFPTEKQFVSYLALSPHNRISGGKLHCFAVHTTRAVPPRAGSAKR